MRVPAMTSPKIQIDRAWVGPPESAFLGNPTVWLFIAASTMLALTTVFHLNGTLAAAPTIAINAVAFYMMFLITVSFYVKKWIGHNVWRAIHMTSFGTFIGAGLHGVFSGTDTSHPVVLAMYVSSLAMVALLLMIRIAQAAAPASEPRRAARSRVPEEAKAGVGS